MDRTEMVGCAVRGRAAVNPAFVLAALLAVLTGCGGEVQPSAAAGESQNPGGCGNGVCSGKETCSTCPGDCGSCRFCGDGACNGDETCSDCSADCGTCPTFCGDERCNAGETCDDCALDCGACPTGCGDGTCSGAETCATCADDCGSCPPTVVCGDGHCSGDETCATCAGDCGACPTLPSCGDGTCNGTETCAACAGDCGACASAPGRIAFVSDRSGEVRIYLANPDGSGVTALTAGIEPAWSPDGRKIAFRGGDPEGVRVIDVNGANERFLRAGGFPTWSPDGTQIAYADGYGYIGIGSEGGIFVMNADGTNPRLLLGQQFAFYDSGWLGDMYGVYAPAWSPDGQTIAFVSYNALEWRIYTMNADGSGSPSPAPVSGPLQMGPAWSPDGSRIAYVRGWNSEEIASSARTDGADLEVHVNEGSGAHLGDPAWSPDGRGLVFSRSSPWEAGPVTYRIFNVREDGSVGQLIPEAQSPARSFYQDWDPAWSWAE